MADPNFEIDELTEAERLAEEARIRAIAGGPVAPHNGPMMLDGKPYSIPGPPSEADAQRGRQIRQDTARSILGRLDGTESKEFLTKLKLNANLAPENAAAPANAASGFTPVVASDVGNLSEQAAEINEANARGRYVEPRNEVVNQIQMPPMGGGVPTIDDVNRAAANIEPQSAGFDAGSQFDPIDLLTRAGVAIRDHDYFPDENATFSVPAVGQNRMGPNMADDLAITEERMGALEEEFRKEAERRGDVTGAEAAGYGVNRGGRRAATFVGGVGADIKEGFTDNIAEPTSDFFGAMFGRGNDEANESVEDANATVPETGNNAADAVVRKEQDQAWHPPMIDAPPDRVTPVTAISDDPAQESTLTSELDGVVGDESKFYPTATGGFLRTTGQHDLDAPPLKGTEIIRGSKRSYQPFNEKGIGFPALGEQPVGDDDFERFQNSGMTRDQSIDAVRATAQQQLAAGNAATATVVTDPVTGERYEGFNIVQGDGTVRTERSDNLVPIGADIVQTVAKDKHTSVSGEVIEATRAQFFQKIYADDGSITLKPMRIDTSIDPTTLRNNNQAQTIAADKEVKRQFPGLTGQALKDKQHEMLVILLDAEQ